MYFLQTQVIECTRKKGEGEGMRKIRMAHKTRWLLGSFCIVCCYAGMKTHTSSYYTIHVRIVISPWTTDSQVGCLQPLIEPVFP